MGLQILNSQTILPQSSQSANALVKSQLSNNFLIVCQSAFLTDNNGSLTVLPTNGDRCPVQVNRGLIRRPPTSLTVLNCTSQNDWPKDILYGDSTGSIHIINDQSYINNCGNPHGASISFCDKNIAQ